MRKFNTEGACDKVKHYMVDISKKLKQIRVMVDEGDYFTINRGRQYGKTTTLYQLRELLKHEYICLKISFEGSGEVMFSSEEAFCVGFLDLLSIASDEDCLESNMNWRDNAVTNFRELNSHISKMCKSRKVVLMIDEVDKSSNNQIFLHFLGVLRSKYLSRSAGDDNTFHSVILAGVNDIKNIKHKMITAGTHTQSSGEGIYNSPWNIAAKFKVDMSFNSIEIESMLTDYESEHSTGMNTVRIAAELYDYTSGYPFLVSCLCKIIDEDLDKKWSVDGVQEAVKFILDDDTNILFESLISNIKNSPELAELVRSLIISGDERPFDALDSAISLGVMYGFLEKRNNLVAISNKIFEIRITRYSIVHEIGVQNRSNPVISSDVINNGKFDMETCLRKFSEHYYELYSDRDTAFLEREGRMLFLTFMKPLINGIGFYHIETETRNARRMDIILDYNKEQFIIELKLWHGKKYKEKAYAQLLDYMDSKNNDTGYLITFDFRKDVNKERQAEWVDCGDGKRIFDVVV